MVFAYISAMFRICLKMSSLAQVKPKAMYELGFSPWRLNLSSLFYLMADEQQKWQTDLPNKTFTRSTVILYYLTLCLLSQRVTCTQLSVSYMHAALRELHARSSQRVTCTQLSVSYMHAALRELHARSSQRVTCTQLSESYMHAALRELHARSSQRVTCTQLSVSYMHATLKELHARSSQSSGCLTHTYCRQNDKQMAKWVLTFAYWNFSIKSCNTKTFHIVETVLKDQILHE